MPPMANGSGADSGNGWEEYKRLVLAEQAKTGIKLDRLDDKLDRLCLQVAVLKVKASAWGALGGLIAALSAIVVALVARMGS